MPQELSFPGLGLSFVLDRVAFYLPTFLGGGPIYWYGIIIAFGFLAALTYILSRTKVFGLDTDRVFDILFVTIILGIVGARLYFVAFNWEDYTDDIMGIFRTWEGGLAIYGGILFGILGIWIASSVRRVKLLPMFDLAVGGVLLGQAIGRWGNFVNIEAFGGNTSLPWGMTGPSIVDYLSSQQKVLENMGMTINPQIPVHPTFFYESLWCLIGFFLIMYLTKKRRFDGQLTLVYLGWYGIGRFFIEGLRTDSLTAGSIRVSRFLGLVFFILSAASLVIMFWKIKKENNPDYLPLYVTTEESQLIVAGKFYDEDKTAKKGNNKKPPLENSQDSMPEPEPLPNDMSKEKPIEDSLEDDNTSQKQK